MIAALKTVFDALVVVLFAAFFVIGFFGLFWVPSILCVAVGGSVQTCGL